MSMNKFMHPKNIYKSPPNFKQLAIEYPEFRKHVKQDITGKVTLDFKDANALRALSCTLMKKDFGLNVVIPADKLVPTIPLRLNYLLWLDDLLQLIDKRDAITGIDIGTGSSCVYPLIGCKQFGWKMIGTEVDAASLKCAKGNIETNCLEDDIKLLEVSGETLLEEVFRNFPEEYDFCMCNPPFFSSTQELHPFFKSRKAGRPHPRNAFVATANEVVSDGGEIKFITKLINESKVLLSKVRIYSTMIGHKSSLNPLKKLLREVEVKSFKETEFCQGHTTRWGLAWTYCDFDLRKIPPSLAEFSKKNKIKAPLKYVVPKVQDLYTVDVVTKCLLKLFNKLQIDFELIKKGKTYSSYTITARKNTWSHQRRKKREQKRLNDVLTKTAENCTPDSEMLNNTTSDSHNDPFESSDSIRAHENSSETANTSSESAEMEHIETSSAGSNKRAFEEDENEVLDLNFHKKMKIVGSNNGDDIYLSGIIIVKSESLDIFIEINSVESTTDRERLHQVLQYIKNNLKLEALV